MYSLPLESQTCPARPSAMITSWVTLPKPPPGSTRRAVSTSSRSASLRSFAGIPSSCLVTAATLRVPASSDNCRLWPPASRPAQSEDAAVRLRGNDDSVVDGHQRKKGRAMVHDGDKAPELDLPTENGETLALSSLK